MKTIKAILLFLITSYCLLSACGVNAQHKAMDFPFIGKQWEASIKVSEGTDKHGVKKKLRLSFNQDSLFTFSVDGKEYKGSWHEKDVLNELNNLINSTDHGLKQVNHDFESNKKATMLAFRALSDSLPKKAFTYFHRASKADSLAEKAYQAIEKMKHDIVEKSGGYNEDSSMMMNTDDITIATKYFVEERHGDSLRALLIKINNDLGNLTISRQGYPSIENKFSIGDPPKSEGVKKSWSEYYFEDVPVIAAYTLLTAFQNDVCNAEMKTINYNFEKAGGKITDISVYKEKKEPPLRREAKRGMNIIIMNINNSEWMGMYDPAIGALDMYMDWNFDKKASGVQFRELEK